MHVVDMIKWACADAVGFYGVDVHDVDFYGLDVYKMFVLCAGVHGMGVYDYGIARKALKS